MSRWKSSRKANESVTVELPTVELERTVEKENVYSPISGNRLYFYSDVTGDSIYTLNRQIDELTKHLKSLQFNYKLSESPFIELCISSDGGEVFPALSSVDRIINNPIPIHTHCEGIVASAATFISVVGKRRTMSKNSSMLIHQISSGLWGNYQQFKDEMENLDLIMKLVKNIYLTNTKFTQSDLEDMLKHDLCLSADDCLKSGLIDEIV